MWANPLDFPVRLPFFLCPHPFSCPGSQFSSISHDLRTIFLTCSPFSYHKLFWYSTAVLLRLVLLSKWETDREMERRGNIKRHFRHPGEKNSCFLRNVLKERGWDVPRQFFFHSRESHRISSHQEADNHMAVERKGSLKGRGKTWMNEWEVINITVCHRFTHVYNQGEIILQCFLTITSKK